MTYTRVMKYPAPEQFLMSQDKKLANSIKRYYPITARSGRESYFESLVRTIVGQQISVKAATKIFGRLVDITRLEPTIIAILSDEQTSFIGLSSQKRRYLSDLAGHFVDNPSVFNHLEKLTDDEVISELTKVKGIGVWSAQMFLIFTLNRPDIFAPDGRGLQVAIERLYGPRDAMSRKELEDFAKRWSPHRSAACLYLWQSLQNSPI